MKHRETAILTGLGETHFAPCSGTEATSRFTYFEPLLKTTLAAEPLSPNFSDFCFNTDQWKGKNKN